MISYIYQVLRFLKIFFMLFSSLQDEAGEITFYLKGADMVMQSIVQYNDWLEEEVRFPFFFCTNLIV